MTRTRATLAAVLAALAVAAVQPAARPQADANDGACPFIFAGHHDCPLHPFKVWSTTDADHVLVIDAHTYSGAQARAIKRGLSTAGNIEVAPADDVVTFGIWHPETKRR